MLLEKRQLLCKWLSEFLLHFLWPNFTVLKIKKQNSECVSYKIAANGDMYIFTMIERNFKNYAPKARNMFKITFYHGMVITYRIVCGAIFGDRMSKRIIKFWCPAFSTNKKIIRCSDWKTDIYKKYPGLALAARLSFLLGTEQGYLFFLWIDH